jgi:hypothetical protein
LPPANIRYASGVGFAATASFDEDAEKQQTLHMTTTLDLPDDLVEDIHLRAEKEGRGLDETVVELLRAGLAADVRESTTAVPEGDPRAAIDRLRTLRRGVRLEGESIRDLIEQGRRN